MKRSFAIALLSGVLIMNMGMFCHSLCAGGGHEKTRMHHSAAHKMKAAHVMPQGESCPLSHQMTHHKGQGRSHVAKQTLAETFIKCGCTTEDEASSAYEAIPQDCLNNPTSTHPFLKQGTHPFRRTS